MTELINLANNSLRAGKIISFATDTVYGLAVDASNFNAVEDLYKIKNRKKDKPIAIFLKNLEEARKLFYFDETAKKISKNFLPGSLTLVLKTKPQAASLLASNLNQNSDGFLGFRILDQKFTQDLLEKFGGIIAVTSANPAGKKPAINSAEVEKYFSNLGLIINGGTCEKKIASTVVKISNNKIEILRQGSVKL
jgi:L-threonylcarbamoyladenylate synthase